MEELKRHAVLVGAALSVLKEAVSFNYQYPDGRRAIVTSDGETFVIEVFFSEHSSQRHEGLSYEAAVFLLGYFHKYKG